MEIFENFEALNDLSSLNKICTFITNILSMVCQELSVKIDITPPLHQNRGQLKKYH